MSRATGHHRGPASNRRDGLGTARVTRRARTTVDRRPPRRRRRDPRRGAGGRGHPPPHHDPDGHLPRQATSAAAETRQREAAVQLADSWVEILATRSPPPAATAPWLTDHTSPTAVGRPSRHRRPRRRPSAAPPTPSPPPTRGGTPTTVGHPTCARRANPRAPPTRRSSSCWSPSLGRRQTRASHSDTTEINYPKPGLQTDGFLAINVTNNRQPDVNGNSGVRPSPGGPRDHHPGRRGAPSSVRPRSR